MSKSATKEKNTTGLDQNAIRRAAKARRKNTPRKNNTPGFSIREAKKERALNLREQREEARRVAIELRNKRLMGLLVNECINRVFAGADATGLCFLYPVEQTQYATGIDKSGNPCHLLNDNGDKIELPIRYTPEVRQQAQQEIADWCEKNLGKYECKLKYDSKTDSTTLALANLMFVKKG